MPLFFLGLNSDSSCQDLVVVKPQGIPLKPPSSLQLTCAHVGVLPAVGLSSFPKSCIQSPLIARNHRLRVKTWHEGLHRPLRAGEGRRTVEPATSQHLTASRLLASPSASFQFIPQVILCLTQRRRPPDCKLWLKDNI